MTEADAIWESKLRVGFKIPTCREDETSCGAYGRVEGEDPRQG
jgi:hypothetical protein